MELVPLFHPPLTWCWNIALKNILAAFPVLSFSPAAGGAGLRGNCSPAEPFFKGDFFGQEEGMSDIVAE